MQKTINQGRWKLLVIILSGLLLMVAGRLFSIQVLQHKNFSNQKQKQITKIQNIVGIRGKIISADGNILAISNICFSLCADPSKIKEPQKTAKLLSSLLNIPYNQVLQKISKKQRRFVWIKRKLSDKQFLKLRNLKIEGVFFQKETQRHYPFGKVACHILGFTGTDGRGLEGIEYILDRFVFAKTERVKIIHDAKGRTLSNLPLEILLNNQGFDVHLTIDIRIQKIVEEELDNILQKWKPTSCSAIVMHPYTGKILAIASRPNFDPNKPHNYKQSSWRNRAVTDPYEPGSTFKPITLSIAMSLGLVHPEMIFHCENGRFKIDGRIITDVCAYGNLTVREIITKSSNVGAVKIGLLIPKRNFYEFLKAFGFARKTACGLPGETSGKLTELQKWNLYTHTSVPFGYEILVSPLQLLNAFCCIANGGKLMKPYIVSKITSHNGKIVFENEPQKIKRVMAKHISRLVVDILTSVVKEGTGKRANIKGIEVAGKTGTTLKFNPITRTYRTNKYISTFVGFAPAHSPRIAVIVVVDEPKGKYYGGVV
jgi:cell division protein FtsI (penicillin-binding protein 3)